MFALQFRVRFQQIYNIGHRNFHAMFLAFLSIAFLAPAPEAWAQTGASQPSLGGLRPMQSEDVGSKPTPARPQNPGTSGEEDLAPDQPDQDVIREPEAADINTDTSEEGADADADIGTVDELANDPFAGPPGGTWISGKAARFTALDKITGRTAPLIIGLDKQARFGTLEIKPRACLTRPPDEAPESTVFVEVIEYDLETEEPHGLFSGWMFASSPALNALEHPIYDVWLTSCAIASGASTPAPASSE